MITLFLAMLLLACGEEKVDDSAEATEQEEQTVEDTAEQLPEDPEETPEEETQDTAVEE